MAIVVPMSRADSLSLFDLPVEPDFSVETRLMKNGARIIAGIDEAGRGPLAGPVVAAAVVLDPNNIPEGLNDSKALSESKREILFHEILAHSHVSWASLSAGTIDALNILQASLLAMTQAVNSLPVTTDHCLIDGRDVPKDLVGQATALIKGDARSVSIAAASIIAKVIRDRMMVQSDVEFPDYGFASHKGYGSKKHREAIISHGPCPLHRKSFSPIKQMI